MIRGCVPLLIFLIACGGGSSSADSGAASADSGSSSADSASPDADPDVSFANPHGILTIVEGRYVDDEGDEFYSRASGHIGAEPPVGFHSESMRIGSCRLLEFEVANCEPLCVGFCVDTNVCVPWPSYESAGAITVTGLAVAVTMIVRGGLNSYESTDSPLPAELFAAGAAITATASGATIAGFSIDAAGVADLDIDLDLDGVSLTLANGADAIVTWTPQGGDNRVRLIINSPSQAHGLPFPAIIECDGPDNGSLTIPQAMVEAMPELTVPVVCVNSECPISSMERYRRGTTTVGSGEIELVIASRVHFGVIHPAL